MLDAEDAQVAIRYSDITGRAIREVILEMVRLQEFLDRPSRLSCLYAARNIEEALKWKLIVGNSSTLHDLSRNRSRQRFRAPNP